MQKRVTSSNSSAPRLPLVIGTAAIVAAALAGAWMKGADQRAIRKSFDAWALGDGSFYDLMDDDAEVVLAGTASHTGTYRKDTFMREVAGPLMSRFVVKPVPKLRRIWSSSEGVIVQADAVGTTVDHQPYAQSYVFVFDMKEGRVTRATEYLDMVAFAAVWDRVDPAPPHDRDRSPAKKV